MEKRNHSLTSGWKGHNQWTKNHLIRDDHILIMELWSQVYVLLWFTTQSSFRVYEMSGPSFSKFFWKSHRENHVKWSYFTARPLFWRLFDNFFLPTDIFIWFCSNISKNPVSHLSKESCFGQHLDALWQNFIRAGATKDCFQAFYILYQQYWHIAKSSASQWTDVPGSLSCYSDEIISWNVGGGSSSLLFLFSKMFSIIFEPLCVCLPLDKFFTPTFFKILDVEERKKTQTSQNIKRRIRAHTLQDVPCLRDIQMFIEFFGFNTEFFPICRTEVAESHNKYIKTEILQGLTRQSAHQSAIKNEQFRLLIEMLCSGMLFGPNHISSSLTCNEIIEEIIKVSRDIPSYIEFDNNSLNFKTFARMGVALNVGLCCLYVICFLIFQLGDQNFST